MTIVLKLKELDFAYPKAKHKTLDIGRLELERGEKVFLQGPSGCGKSTLLNLIGGVLSPLSGSIEILGKNMCKLNWSQKDKFRADHIGFIFQQFNLITYMNVFENVLLPLKYSKERKRKCAGRGIKHEVERLLNRLGLENEKYTNISSLSVGQQQRVAVARALLGNPEIIIADEPTSALDHLHQDKFISLLLEEVLKNNATLLFVSHNPTLSSHFDRVISMKEIQRGGSK